jgi:uncharacterized cupredoxin-like copper-binding protein
MTRSHVLRAGLGSSCFAAGIASALFIGWPAHASSPRGVAASTAATTTILVTAGKPTEFAFTLSKRQVPAGLVSFKVTNRGKAIHTFKVCTSTTARTATVCAGSVTHAIAPGKSQTLVVKLSKGVHEFICTIPGHANLGMRGLLGVAVNPPANTTTTTSTTTQTTTTQTTTTHTTTTNANPDGCPPGTTIQTAGFGGDGDDDEAGGVSDGDGCI